MRESDAAGLMGEIGMQPCSILWKVFFFPLSLSLSRWRRASPAERLRSRTGFSLCDSASAAAGFPSWGLIELSRLQICHRGPVRTLSPQNKRGTRQQIYTSRVLAHSSPVGLHEKLTSPPLFFYFASFHTP